MAAASPLIREPPPSHGSSSVDHDGRSGRIVIGSLVAGLVLGETSPFWSWISPAVGRVTRVCAYDRAGQGWSDDADSTARRLTALLPSLGRLDVGQLLYAAVGSDLPEPATTQARAFATSARDMRSQRDELSTYHDVFRLAQAMTTLNGKPLVVVTATDDALQGWSAAQDRLAALSSNSSHRAANVTHAALLDQHHGSQISTRAIDDVVQSVRTGSPPATQ